MEEARKEGRKKEGGERQSGRGGLVEKEIEDEGEGVD